MTRLVIIKIISSPFYILQNRVNSPSGSDVEEIHEVAKDAKVIHVGKSLASLLAHLFDVCIVVLLQRRLSRQRLLESTVRMIKSQFPNVNVRQGSRSGSHSHSRETSASSPCLRPRHRWQPPTLQQTPSRIDPTSKANYPIQRVHAGQFHFSSYNIA